MFFVQQIQVLSKFVVLFVPFYLQLQDASQCIRKTSRCMICAVMSLVFCLWLIGVKIRSMVAQQCQGKILRPSGYLQDIQNQTFYSDQKTQPYDHFPKYFHCSSLLSRFNPGWVFIELLQMISQHSFLSLFLLVPAFSLMIHTCVIQLLFN